MPLCTLNIYLGTDLIHIPRVEPVLHPFGKCSLQRVYPATEQQDSKQQDCWQTHAHPADRKHQFVRLAGRWAAKDAGAKALRLGRQGIHCTGVEIARQSSRALKACFYSVAVTIAKRYGSGTWQLSLSHVGDYAIATAVFLDDQNSP